MPAGGAALSVKQVTGVPIKFIGTARHLDNLEEFHPDRMASRILAWANVLTLVEQAQQKFDQDEMQKQEEQLRKGEITLDTFRDMMRQVRKLGPLQKSDGHDPRHERHGRFDDSVRPRAKWRRFFGMIDSMTPEERRNPGVIDQSRRRRIAVGSGVEPHAVNDLVKQFDGMGLAHERDVGLGMRDRMRKMQQLQQGGFLDPGNRLSRGKVGTGQRLSADEKRQTEKAAGKRAAKKRNEIQEVNKNRWYSPRRQIRMIGSPQVRKPQSPRKHLALFTTRY